MERTAQKLGEKRNIDTTTHASTNTLLEQRWGEEQNKLKNWEKLEMLTNKLLLICALSDGRGELLPWRWTSTTLWRLPTLLGLGWTPRFLFLTNQWPLPQSCIYKHCCSLDLSEVSESSCSLAMASYHLCAILWLYCIFLFVQIYMYVQKCACV